MRAFKFFFGLTLAVIVFSFVFKIFFFAFIVAAVLSSITFFIRKMRYFSNPRYEMDCRHRHYSRNLPPWMEREEDLVPSFEEDRNYEKLTDVYHIEVR